MTQTQVDTVTAKAKTDAAFRRSLREDAEKALSGYDLTAPERSALKAQNLGAEPTGGKGSAKMTPAQSFASKTHVDPKTGKTVDNETGKEVSPPPDPDAKPGGTLGGRTVPPA